MYGYNGDPTEADVDGSKVPPQEEDPEHYE